MGLDDLWDEIPAEYLWVAANANGGIYAFTSQPYFSSKAGTWQARHSSKTPKLRPVMPENLSKRIFCMRRPNK